MGEAKVLVCGEDTDGEQVGLAHVVDEPADVAIEAGIDAVYVSHLQGVCLSRGQPWVPNEWIKLIESSEVSKQYCTKKFSKDVLWFTDFILPL